MTCVKGAKVKKKYCHKIIQYDGDGDGDLYKNLSAKTFLSHKETSVRLLFCYLNAQYTVTDIISCMKYIQDL